MVGGNSNSNSLVGRMGQGSTSKSTGTQTTCWSCDPSTCTGFDVTFGCFVVYENQSLQSGFTSSITGDFSPSVIVPQGHFGIQATMSIDVTTYYGDYIILPLSSITRNGSYNVNLKPYRNAVDACPTCLNVGDSNYNVNITYTGI